MSLNILSLMGLGKPQASGSRPLPSKYDTDSTDYDDTDSTDYDEIICMQPFETIQSPVFSKAPSASNPTRLPQSLYPSGDSVSSNFMTQMHYLALSEKMDVTSPYQRYTSPSKSSQFYHHYHHQQLDVNELTPTEDPSHIAPISQSQAHQMDSLNKSPGFASSNHVEDSDFLNPDFNNRWQLNHHHQYDPDEITTQPPAPVPTTVEDPPVEGPPVEDSPVEDPPLREENNAIRFLASPMFRLVATPSDMELSHAALLSIFDDITDKSHHQLHSLLYNISRLCHALNIPYHCDIIQLLMNASYFQVFFQSLFRIMTSFPTIIDDYVRYTLYNKSIIRRFLRKQSLSRFKSLISTRPDADYGQLPPALIDEDQDEDRDQDGVASHLLLGHHSNALPYTARNTQSLVFSPNGSYIAVSYGLGEIDIYYFPDLFTHSHGNLPISLSKIDIGPILTINGGKWAKSQMVGTLMVFLDEQYLAVHHKYGQSPVLIYDIKSLIEQQKDENCHRPDAVHAVDGHLLSPSVFSSGSIGDAWNSLDMVADEWDSTTNSSLDPFHQVNMAKNDDKNPNEHVPCLVLDISTASRPSAQCSSMWALSQCSSTHPWSTSTKATDIPQLVLGVEQSLLFYSIKASSEVGTKSRLDSRTQSLAAEHNTTPHPSIRPPIQPPHSTTTRTSELTALLECVISPPNTNLQGTGLHPGVGAAYSQPYCLGVEHRPSHPDTRRHPQRPFSCHIYNNGVITLVRHSAISKQEMRLEYTANISTATVYPYQLGSIFFPLNGSSNPSQDALQGIPLPHDLPSISTILSYAPLDLPDSYLIHPFLVSYLKHHKYHHYPRQSALRIGTLETLTKLALFLHTSDHHIYLYLVDQHLLILVSQHTLVSSQPGLQHGNDRNDGNPSSLSRDATMALGRDGRRYNSSTQSKNTQHNRVRFGSKTLFTARLCAWPQPNEAIPLPMMQPSSCLFGSQSRQPIMLSLTLLVDGMVYQSCIDLSCVFWDQHSPHILNGHRLMCTSLAHVQHLQPNDDDQGPLLSSSISPHNLNNGEEHTMYTDYNAHGYDVGQMSPAGNALAQATAQYISRIDDYLDDLMNNGNSTSLFAPWVRSNNPVRHPPSTQSSQAHGHMVSVDHPSHAVTQNNPTQQHQVPEVVSPINQNSIYICAPLQSDSIQFHLPQGMTPSQPLFHHFAHAMTPWRVVECPLDCYDFGQFVSRDLTHRVEEYHSMLSSCSVTQIPIDSAQTAPHTGNPSSSHLSPSSSANVDPMSRDGRQHQQQQQRRRQQQQQQQQGLDPTAQSVRDRNRVWILRNISINDVLQVPRFPVELSHQETPVRNDRRSRGLYSTSMNHQDINTLRYGSFSQPNLCINDIYSSSSTLGTCVQNVTDAIRQVKEITRCAEGSDRPYVYGSTILEQIIGMIRHPFLDVYIVLFDDNSLAIYRQ